MKHLLLLSALIAAPAYATCDPRIGAGERLIVRTATPLESDVEYIATMRRLGERREADRAEEELREGRQKWLGAKVKLGYTYLDNKCYAEARQTFKEVWEWNRPGYVVYAQQAREALNLMDSKGQ